MLSLKFLVDKVASVPLIVHFELVVLGLELVKGFLEGFVGLLEVGVEGLEVLDG